MAMLSWPWASSLSSSARCASESLWRRRPSCSITSIATRWGFLPDTRQLGPNFANFAKFWGSEVSQNLNEVCRSFVVGMFPSSLIRGKTGISFKRPGWLHWPHGVYSQLGRISWPAESSHLGHPFVASQETSSRMNMRSKPSRSTMKPFTKPRGGLRNRWWALNAAGRFFVAHIQYIIYLYICIDDFRNAYIMHSVMYIHIEKLYSVIVWWLVLKN